MASASYDIGDYNKGGFQAFVFTMVATMLFFIYIAFIHPGVDLQELEQAKKAAEAPQKVEGQAE